MHAEYSPEYMKIYKLSYFTRFLSKNYFYLKNGLYKNGLFKNGHYNTRALEYTGFTIHGH